MARPESYDLLTQILHWLMAILMITLLIMGVYMTRLPDGDPKWFWYDLHKSIGSCIFLLFLFRVVWRSRQTAPADPAHMRPWERAAAHGAHLLLYTTMLLLPVTGYIDASAGGYHLSLFGWFEVPMLIAKNETLFELAVTAHRLIAYALMGVIALHLLAALKHHFVDHDTVLLRMLPFVSLKSAESGKSA